MTRVPEKFNKDNWCTPLEILALVYGAIGIPDLDPCSGPGSLVVSKRAITKKQDGRDLKKWKGARTVFMNPPYSDALGWAERFLEYLENTPDFEGVMLLNLEPGLKWWQEKILPRRDMAMHLPLRVAFLANGVPVKGNRANSALLYFGGGTHLVGQCWPAGSTFLLCPSWRDTRA